MSAGGYGVDEPYLASFHQEYAPIILRTLGVIRGRRAPGENIPVKFLDLGCGPGFGLTLLAAANPHSTFVGIDISPDHILEARKLAADAGVANVTFHHASFAEFSESARDVGEIDIVACHGVYTWVDPETRRSIVEIVSRVLRPGGVFVVGYNAMPGGAMMQPIRDTVRHLAETRRGTGRDAAIDETFRFLELLKEQQAGFMGPASAMVLALTDAFRRADTRYRRHELLPLHGGAVWHHELASDLERAQLGYLGSARLVENFDSMNFERPIRAEITRADAMGHGELLRDLAANRQFRIDVFARGSLRMTPEEAEAALMAVKVVRAKTPIPTPQMRTARGTIEIAPGLAGPLLSGMDDRPVTLGSLIATADAAAHERQRARLIVLTLLAGKWLQPTASTEIATEAQEACVRFNRAVPASSPAFASPILAGGFIPTDAERTEMFDECASGASMSIIDYLVPGIARFRTHKQDPLPG